MSLSDFSLEKWIEGLKDKDKETALKFLDHNLKVGASAEDFLLYSLEDVNRELLDAYGIRIKQYEDFLKSKKIKYAEYRYKLDDGVYATVSIEV